MVHFIIIIVVCAVFVAVVVIIIVIVVVVFLKCKCDNYWLRNLCYCYGPKSNEISAKTCTK